MQHDSGRREAVSGGAGAEKSAASARMIKGSLALARIALFSERLWSRAWPLLAVCAGFAVLALFDCFADLPVWLHVPILCLAAGALGFALWHLRTGFRRPGLEAARRRVEQSSGLAHRPLTALSDRIAGDTADPVSRALWQAHLGRMAVTTRHLRFGWPRLSLAAQDPFALRALLVLLLFVAAIDAGERAPDRFARALNPALHLPPVVPASVDVWVNPPDYTGLPPVFLKSGSAGEAVDVPSGSTVLAQLHGGGSVPRLKLDDAATDFTAVDAENFRVSARITSGSLLSLERDGEPLGSWPIRVLPDQPPTIAFAKPPQQTEHAALRLEYHASDDYGVTGVKAVIRRPGESPTADKPGNGNSSESAGKETSEEDAIQIELPLPVPNPKDGHNAGFQDLTAHVWAGLPVEIRLIAKDGLGQTGTSDPVVMKLPERVFNHPIARAVIEQRKRLTLDPSQRQEVAEALSELASRPGLFRDDVVAFLALRVATGRLIFDREAAAIREVQQLLWETALRIEEGQLSLAQRDLRELQKQLQDALARNAPDAEIDRLMNELRQAMDRYLQAMAEAMQRMDPAQLKNLPPADPSQMVSAEDLRRLLERARELARTGSREAARDLLASLQDMLENLRAAQPQQGQDAGEQAMRQLQELMQRQQQLLDRSFRAAQQQEQQGGQQGTPKSGGQGGRQGQKAQGQSAQGQHGQGRGQSGSAEAAGEQEALRQRLGEMMRQLGDAEGEIPQSFGPAEKAMREAVEALKQGQPGQAVNPQSRALDEMQQAAREMAEQMAKQDGQGEGSRSGRANAQSRQAERDPLGRMRQGQGGYDQSDVKIPEEADIQKSRGILDELRRRAGERFRPEFELDYIDRLLQRF
jgi:uncharacterized protein (TIGR02302 family)